MLWQVVATLLAPPTAQTIGLWVLDRAWNIWRWSTSPFPELGSQGFSVSRVSVWSSILPLLFACRHSPQGVYSQVQLGPSTPISTYSTHLLGDSQMISPCVWRFSTSCRHDLCCPYSVDARSVLRQVAVLLLLVPWMW